MWIKSVAPALNLRATPSLSRGQLGLLPDVSEYGPLPHLPARSFRPHHSRVFRRVRIGRRSDARGSHATGTVGRGRSLERRPLRHPSEPRGSAPLGPVAGGVDGVLLAAYGCAAAQPERRPHELHYAEEFVQSSDSRRGNRPARRISTAPTPIQKRADSVIQYFRLGWRHRIDQRRFRLCLTKKRDGSRTTANQPPQRPRGIQAPGAGDTRRGTVGRA